MSTTVISATKPRVESKGCDQIIAREELDAIAEHRVIKRIEDINRIPTSATFTRVSRPDLGGVMFRWKWYEITID